MALLQALGGDAVVTSGVGSLNGARGVAARAAGVASSTRTARTARGSAGSTSPAAPGPSCRTGRTGRAGCREASLQRLPGRSAGAVNLGAGRVAGQISCRARGSTQGKGDARRDSTTRVRLHAARLVHTGKTIRATHGDVPALAPHRTAPGPRIRVPRRWPERHVVKLQDVRAAKAEGAEGKPSDQGSTVLRHHCLCSPR